MYSLTFCSSQSYFSAALPTSDSKNLYKVPIPTELSLQLLQKGGTPPPPAALTNDSTRGYYSSHFSPDGGYFTMKYEGPDVPYQKVMKSSGGMSLAFDLEPLSNTGSFHRFRESSRKQ
jgi:dipeptidyl aminopeptidase B